MKNLFYVLCFFIGGALLSSQSTHAQNESKTRLVYACTEDRNLWQYLVDVYEVLDDDQLSTGQYFGVLSERNIFRNRRRVLRPYVEIDTIENSDSVSAPARYLGEQFTLDVFLGIRDRDGYYATFVGKSHRGNDLTLRMHCN